MIKKLPECFGFFTVAWELLFGEDDSDQKKEPLVNPNTPEGSAQRKKALENAKQNEARGCQGASEGEKVDSEDDLVPK